MQDRIDANNGRFSEALAHGDAVAAAAVYGNRATLFPPQSEPVAGRKAIEDFWRGGIEVGLRSVELETVELTAAGDLAYEIGRYRLVVEREDRERANSEATSSSTGANPTARGSGRSKSSPPSAARPTRTGGACS